MKVDLLVPEPEALELEVEAEDEAFMIENGCDSRGLTSMIRTKACAPGSQVSLVGMERERVVSSSILAVARCGLGLWSSIMPKRESIENPKRTMIA